MKGFFVTGTDTGIGKTVVSTILTLGLQAIYWKPVQTGACEGTDSDFVRTWIESDRVHPETYIFPDPLSPHQAAKNCGATIELEKIMSQVPVDSPLIVEGAGGVLVPLNSQKLMIDLMAQIGLPTILVASTKLGTINHSLLTIESLQRREIPIAGVVMVGPEHASPWRAIEEYSGARVLGHVPWTDSLSSNFFQESFHQLSGGLWT